MKPYAEMTKEELVALRKDLKAKYHDFQTKDLRLDMSRGKPSADQLDLSMGMMDVLSSDDDLTCEDGTDCRNYGVLTGIDEAKVLHKTARFQSLKVDERKKLIQLKITARITVNQNLQLVQLPNEQTTEHNFLRAVLHDHTHELQPRLPQWKYFHRLHQTDVTPYLKDRNGLLIFRLRVQF